MATDQGNVVVDGCLGVEADRISDLPDHLLHRILICLPSTADAARTSVLSRRWRRVWTHLPELALRHHSTECVDAALAAWSAPVLHCLHIALRRLEANYSRGGAARRVMAERVCSWLRFASERLVGELRLSLPWLGEAIELPVRGRLTAITLASAGGYIPHQRLRFQLHPTAGTGGGVFTALAALTIERARMDCRELEEAVSSSRCPRLKELVLNDIILQLSDDDHVLSIRSDSLEKLRLRVAYAIPALQLKDGRRLQLQVAIATPELQELSLYLAGEVIDADIAHATARTAAPKHSKLCWSEAGRHLKRLELTSGSSLSLLDRFDAVDELDLNIPLSEGAEEYGKILEDTNKIIKCEVLVVTFSSIFHDFEPIIHHLLRNCLGIRKLVVRLHNDLAPCPCQLSSCPCFLAHDNLFTNGIVLETLQEVVVEGGGDTNQVVKLVSLLCRCSETFQKKVHITISEGNRQSNWYMRAMIKMLLAADPNNKVEISIR